MTFDDAFKLEARLFFERRGDLEIANAGDWELLQDEQITQLAFADPSRAEELASPHGLKLSDGRDVRFRLGQS